MMARKIRVVVADDTLIAREGWKRILELDAGLEVVGEIARAQEAGRIVRELEPDVVLMDLLWFGDETAGATAISQMKKERPSTKIVAISAYAPLIPPARTAGAEAFLPKGFSREELVGMIREVVRLGDFEPITPDHPVRDSISEREREVLIAMASGRTDRDIAKLLVISEATVKNHVRNIIAKLDATNRAHAVAIAYEMGVLKRSGDLRPA